MEDAHDEQAHLEREVEKLRKINDEIRNKSNRLRKELDILKDSIKDLELDSQRPHMEDNEYTRRIRNLENKLDKSMIKYNEAQNIRKTYEQIVKRLGEERVGYDNQLAAIERTLASKQKDYEELLLLSGDANHARETALGELERVRAGYDEERKKREKELREKHQMVQLRRQMLDRMKYRERMRTQLASGKFVVQCIYVCSVVCVVDMLYTLLLYAYTIHTLYNIHSSVYTLLHTTNHYNYYNYTNPTTTLPYTIQALNPNPLINAKPPHFLFVLYNLRK